ncbi:MAG: glycosylhydrolase-like jelly roll fold domain-containing protein, partial [Opitutales bacterium]
QGRLQADVAIFTGERAPNNGGNREHAESEGIPAGNDYDYLNGEVLAEATVEDGRITLPSGMHYRLLVLPKSETMTPALARKVRELVQAGALVLGAKPRRSPSLVGYPDCDAELRNIADEVWGKVDGKRVKQHAFGKGRVYHGLSIEAVLQADGIAPDLQWSHGTFDWQHRQIDGDDFYFVASREAASVAAELSLNVEGKVPEFWYPDTGKIETCGVWRVENGRTIIPLELDPYGSRFIVFRKPGSPFVTELKGDGATVRIANGKPQLVASKSGSFAVTTSTGTQSIKVGALAKPHTISGPWNVSFPPKLGAPESAVFNELNSWTEHPDEGIKYFSGTASYRCDFEVPAAMVGNDQQVMIDLGRVEVIAELFVNGKSAGTLWKPPFKADITALVKAGKNRLEVRVTNPWRNRLIGDEQQPQTMEWRPQGDKGFVLAKWPEWLLNGQPKPDDGRITFTTWRHYNKDSELHSAGLMGPVQIQSTQVLPIR